MNLRILSPLTVALIITVTTAVAQSQPTAKEVFAPLDQKIAEAKGQYADFYSPKFFAEGMQDYQAAVRVFRDQGDGADLQKAILKVSQQLDKAMDQTKIAQATFPDAWNARLDAMEAQAAKYQPEGWQDAEEAFNEAARQLERGKLDNARDDGQEAEELYRKSEAQRHQEQLPSERPTPYRAGRRPEG